MMEIALVYMVAGMSSRFGGKIKQFAKVGPNGETLIEYSLNQAIKAGFDKIVFIVGNLTEKGFKEKFGDSYSGIPVFYAVQKFNPQNRDRPWGTTDAVCALQGVIDCPFVVCNGDDICGESSFKKLVEYLKENKDCATVGQRLSEFLPEKGNVNRGTFELDSNGEVRSIKETFNINRENLSEKGLSEDTSTNLNLFAFQPEILEELNKKLIQFKEKNNGDRKAECLLPIELDSLIQGGKVRIKYYPSTEKGFGVTNPEDEEIVREQLRELELSR